MAQGGVRSRQGPAHAGARGALLVSALAVLAGAAAGWPSAAGAQWEYSYPPPEWSVTFQFGLGGGYDSTYPSRSTSSVTGVALLVRSGSFLIGPLVDGTLSSGHDSAWFGLAAGWAWEPRSWARLQLLGEAGVHDVILESDYVLPGSHARLGYLGARAGALAFTEDRGRRPELAGARRVGAVLQLALRGDLQHGSVLPTVPPELSQPPPLQVGGLACTVLLGFALEW